MINSALDKRVLSRKEVASQLGISLATLYVWIKEKRISKGIQLGARRVVWLQSDIDDFIQKQAKKSRETQTIS